MVARSSATFTPQPLPGAHAVDIADSSAFSSFEVAPNELFGLYLGQLLESVDPAEQDRAIGLVSALLESSDPRLRQTAARYGIVPLSRIDQDNLGLPLIRQLLSDPDSQVSYVALEQIELAKLNGDLQIDLAEQQYLRDLHRTTYLTYNGPLN